MQNQEVIRGLGCESAVSKRILALCKVYLMRYLVSRLKITVRMLAEIRLLMGEGSGQVRFEGFRIRGCFMGLCMLRYREGCVRDGDCGLWRFERKVFFLGEGGGGKRNGWRDGFNGKQRRPRGVKFKAGEIRGRVVVHTY